MLHYFRRRRWDEERAREIEAHLEHHIDDLVTRGLSRTQARQQALREFGNQTLIREEIYEMNSIPLLETVGRDVAYAVRVLRKSPGFTLTAVVTLAIAIAINTAVFSIVDGMLLRPLPYPNADRLMLVQATVEAGGARAERTSQNGFTWVALRDHATTFERAVFSTWISGVNVVARGRAVHAEQQKVGRSFFAVLGTRPLFGREFTDAEDRAGGPAAVILSQEFWRTTLGADPSVVGGTITVRGEPHQVVGIMPAGVYTGASADLWTPLRASTQGEGSGENFHILVRVSLNTDPAAAVAEVARLGAEAERGREAADGVRVTYGLVSLQQGLTDAVRRPLMILWSAVALVLLIACVNLAGLMFARVATRSREIGTRLALGSGRAAVVRQLVVENLVLAATGAAGGLLLAIVVLGRLTSIAADAMDLWQPIALDGRAVVAACVCALIATAIAGVGPACQATSGDIQRRLVARGARTVTGASSHTARRLMVVTQVALGLVLLVGAGLLVRTFAHLRSLEPGFDGAGVHAATVSLQDSRYRTTAQVVQLADLTLLRLREAGVESAGVSLGLPYERLLNLSFRHLDGAEAKADPRMTSATYVAGDYFGTLRIPVLAGRVFDDGDTTSSAPVALVNETFAREYFGGTTPVGRRIAFAGREREIVGVVGDVQVRPGFGDRGPLAAMPLAYIPLPQVSDGMARLVHGWFATSFLVRTAARADRALPAIQGALEGVDPLLPIASIRSMEDVQTKALALPRLLMTLLLALATAALVLTAVGIHGLIASTVTERTREIGIRLALGATSAQAIRSVAAPGIALAVVGTLIGVVAARAAVTLLRAFVWGVSTSDYATFAGAAAFLLLVATAASTVPALGILRLDPARTLRQD